MDKKQNPKGISNLTVKATAIFGAALAAISGIDNGTEISTENQSFEPNTYNIKEYGKPKPMPVLKLNIDNPDKSQFISSHQSHSSHRSHYSHYSHRSGAMFS